MKSTFFAALTSSALVCAATIPLQILPAHAEGKDSYVATAASASRYANTGVSQKRSSWRPTAAQQRAMNAKALRASKVQLEPIGAGMRAAGVGIQAAAGNKYLTWMDQHPQERAMWCGPSVFVSLAQARRKKYTQAQAAKFLKTTDKDGTEKGEMARALNQTIGGDYQSVPIAGMAATPQQISDYRKRLVANINTSWGLSLNTLELANGIRLPGHPRGMVIDHLIAVYGYSNYGKVTDWIDPVAGASMYRHWSGTKAYGEMPSATMMHLVAGREYTW